MISLPIDAIKEKIQSSYKTFSNIILKATPGSGKTTRVPLYLLRETDKKIYILEPRRLAAKLAAIFVAKELGEKVGETVGYVFRFEKAVSEKTRILFLTEGTFLKILSQNKNLEGVGLVILDEFHERHLSTDAALSFVTKLQNEARPDLKVLVMSATIETIKLEGHLNQFSPTVTLELNAARFPLNQHFLPNVTSVVQAPLEKKVRNALEDILEKSVMGDILVFLPGMKEIRECQKVLTSLCEHYEIECHVLHGDLDSSAQTLVLSPSKNRKIILSTNIAESSVTIPGIRIVIDSGLERSSSYNFFSGLPELKVTKISKSQAIQRAGRANREAEGWCYRLYAELDYEQRPYFLKPEIERSDLSELYLLALDLFSFPLDKLNWLESPPENALKSAHDLLFSINAVDQNFRITEIGKQILTYPLHPRLGRILTEAQRSTPERYKETLFFLADFLGEKNRERFFRQLAYRGNHAESKDKTLEEILLTGFPDRVARTRGEKYFDVITRNGETVKIASSIAQEFDPHHELWIVMDLNNKGEAIKCVPIEEEWLYDLEPFPLSEDVRYFWDEKKQAVYQSSRTLIGKILLSEENSAPTSSNAEIKKILQDVAKDHIKSLHSSMEYERLLTLNRILLKKDIDHLEKDVLNDFFNDHIHFNDEDKKELSYTFFSALKELIDPEGSYNLDVDFPEFIQLTDRRKIPINYDRSKDPWIESYIQDFYGLTKTPILAKGKVPLTLQLLGPHKRAIQVTQDLASFWNKTYPQMLKELMREYPRHHWPENPMTAKPILLKRQLPS
ncbi:MAG: ATP-dependent helicase C-terminal domain-containing protein [Bacteriovorax sp.]